MRIVSVTIQPDPQEGVISLHYSAPAGGRSTVGCPVQAGDSADAVASDLARRINNERQWCIGYFQAQASGPVVMIICKDEVSNVTIYGDPDSDALRVSEWGQP